MARSHKNWANVRPEIYRIMNESESDSFWNATTMLQLANEERTFLQAVLGETFEGWNTQTVGADLVADQAYYQVPADTNRVIRVARVFEGGRKEPLERLERHMEAESGTGGSGFGYLPTYRMEDDYILLSPTPTSNETGGLEIIYEKAVEPIVAEEDSFIPAPWPFLCEEYLKYAIAVAAYEIEGAIGPEAGGNYSSLSAKRDRYLGLLREYCEQRSYGITFGTPFLQAD